MNIPDKTSKRACKIAEILYKDEFPWPASKDNPTVQLIVRTLIADDPEKWGPEEPDYEAWRPVLDRFYGGRGDRVEASTPFDRADIENIKGLMAVMPAEQPEATGDELERAREYAARAWDRRDSLCADHIRGGNWDREEEVEAALIAIREEAKRRPTMSEDQIKELGAWRKWEDAPATFDWLIRETLKRVQS